MSRTPNIVNFESIENLKIHIKQKSGISCNSFNDIEQLVCFIKKDTGECLSVQTLNRFYGLIKNKFSPSVVTLNILSRFLNYGSFEEFEKLGLHKSFSVSPYLSSEKLFKSLFVNPYAACNDKNLKWIFHNIYCMIERNEIQPEDVYQLMAQSPFGRKFFFEEFVYMDKLNGWYGDSLKYLEMHVKTRQEKVFVWSMLCCRYFLNNESTLFNQYFKKLEQIDHLLFESMDMVVLARYNAACIYDAMLNNKPVIFHSEVKNMLCHPAGTHIKGEKFFKAACIIARALILGEFFGQAYCLLNNIKINIYLIEDPEDEARLNEFRLLKLYAGFATGIINAKNAFAELEKIQARPFHLLTKEYYSAFLNIFYLHSQSKTKVKQAKENLEYFTTTTSFQFFKKFADK